jgi:alkanesulfonate monooxygenase SsuD/methylene tetrahydromethanopterin reductase-like flavin-dependent oxidoreductase (luciferase family)
MNMGLFQLLPRAGGVGDASVIAHALGEAARAEALGLDSVWIAEHHLSPFGLGSAPSVYLAALSQRTERVALGYAVAVLPLHQPIRLAEELAWVDQLSKGRLLVGVGPGFSPYELGAFGVSYEDRHGVFAERLAALRGLLGPESTLAPRPFRPEGPPLLRAASRCETLLAATRESMSALLGLRSRAELASMLAEYRARRSDAGASRSDVEREIASFRVLRRVVVSECGDAARRAGRRALVWEAELDRRVHGLPAPIEGDDRGLVAGTPEEVAAELEALGALGLRHVIAWLSFGDLAPEISRRSLELLGEAVIDLRLCSA